MIRAGGQCNTRSYGFIRRSWRWDGRYGRGIGSDCNYAAVGGVARREYVAIGACSIDGDMLNVNVSAHLRGCAAE